VPLWCSKDTRLHSTTATCHIFNVENCGLVFWFDHFAKVQWRAARDTFLRLRFPTTLAPGFQCYSQLVS
jgi:hypothetical protein